MKKIVALAIVIIVTKYTVIAQNKNLNVEKMVLENGFTVYLNEDNTAKEVYGAVVVKAGSKNDPADATGMAHYLEHMLFKGTTALGTSNYEKEKPFLDSINIYYDILGKTTDEIERKKIQSLINKQSVQAAKYGLPTEFDKLIKSIGGTELNAFTTNDMTVYHNAFPGNQINNWLELYSHRFMNPVFRSFQSELEVVYEEKNKGMDNFQFKIFEDINKGLFKHHPYGTQTTIGTTEHLKNPSLTKMYEYFNTYYVANNMALVLSGNFDAQKAKEVIKEKFSRFRKKDVPVFPTYPPTVFNGREVLEVRYTPIKVALMGFKSIPSVHADEAALSVCNSLLFNESGTGLLNKLQRNNKLTLAAALNLSYNDDGALIIIVVPKIVGQSFDEAEKLVNLEITKIKNGEFSDKELLLIKQELYRQRQQELENVQNRAFSIVQTFSEGTTWEDYLKLTAEIENISKEQVIQVAKKYFTENYFALHSKTGFPKKELLTKPGFKPVVTEQKEVSAYANNFINSITPAKTATFLDFNNDTKSTALNGSNALYVTPNKINDIFSLKVVYAVGADSLKNLDLIPNIFSYFGTKELSVDEVKEQFALLGLTYFASCSDERFTIEFSGLEKNFGESLVLINKLLTEPVAEEKAVKTFINDIITDRKTQSKDPAFLGSVLFEYSLYGKNSKYLTQLSNSEIKKIKAADLIRIYKNALEYNAVYHYTGVNDINKVKSLIEKNITLKDNKKYIPYYSKKVVPINENIIYLINDKKAVQTQIYFAINGAIYTGSDTENVQINAFNNYMGGDFSGLIMQEIREFRSLAYTARGKYRKPLTKQGKGYFFSYIGCQADKTNEAIETMKWLINDMPYKPERANDIVSLLKNSASSNYPDFRNISLTIDNYRQLGYQNDPVKDEFKLYDKLDFNNIAGFYEQTIKNKPTAISIYGNKTQFDIIKLSKETKVIELKIKDVLKQ